MRQSQECFSEAGMGQEWLPDNTGCKVGFSGPSTLLPSNNIIIDNTNPV